MKTLAGRLLVSSAIVTAGMLGGGATAAQAVPTGCVLQMETPVDGANVWCSGGTGESRVVLECITIKPGSDPIIATRPGPWVNIQATSSATCSGPPRLYDAWYEVR
ncbi:hypothetical protein [Phytohabitans houttuyneae]|nr:hypothetical protein [Phytohabitans houttuyneae]